MTAAEAKAHVAITDTVQLVLDGRLDDRYVYSTVEPHLRAFRARCNCRRVLMFGPWRDGTRIAACACGASHFESNIWHKVELGEHARR